MLWTAQGAYLTFCANEATLGLYSGIFFTLFITNQVIGNVGAAILLDQGVDTDSVFIVLAVIGALGNLVFGILRPLKSPPPKRINGDEGPKKHIILEVVMLMVDMKAALLATILVYSGVANSFYFGNLPLYINNYSPDVLDLSMKLVHPPPSHILKHLAFLTSCSLPPLPSFSILWGYSVFRTLSLRWWLARRLTMLGDSQFWFLGACAILLASVCFLPWTRSTSSRF